jgi:copper resistance protein B
MNKPAALSAITLLFALGNVVHSRVAAQPAADGHHHHRGHQQEERLPAVHESHSHDHGSAPVPAPLPPPTNRERSSLFISEEGHPVHGDAITALWLLERLEWQDADDGEAMSWDASGWTGGDVDRLWWRTEGERSGGATRRAEVQLLWGHAVGPWWELVAGLRQDFKPGSPQTWGAVGVQGMLLYSLEAEATLYIGEGGQTAARLEGEYDILLTNRLILQPTAEVNLYGRNDPGRSIGRGIADVEAGLRLRYEIRREIAPYIGVSWTRLYGETADLARAGGGSVEDARLVVGIRAWY